MLKILRGHVYGDARGSDGLDLKQTDKKIQVLLRNSEALDPGKNVLTWKEFKKLCAFLEPDLVEKLGGGKYGTSSNQDILELFEFIAPENSSTIHRNDLALSLIPTK